MLWFLSIILSPFTIAHFLILWFQTEFIVEYSKLLSLDKIVPIFKTFKEQEKAGSPLNFKEFLTTNYDSFIVRLITCPVCFATILSFFLNLTVAIFLNIYLAIILWYPIAFLSLYAYEKMKRLMK